MAVYRPKEEAERLGMAGESPVIRLFSAPRAAMYVSLHADQTLRIWCRPAPWTPRETAVRAALIIMAASFAALLVWSILRDRKSLAR